MCLRLLGQSPDTHSEERQTTELLHLSSPSGQRSDFDSAVSRCSSAKVPPSFISSFPTSSAMSTVAVLLSNDGASSPTEWAIANGALATIVSSPVSERNKCSSANELKSAEGYWSQMLTRVAFPPLWQPLTWRKPPYLVLLLQSSCICVSLPFVFLLRLIVFLHRRRPNY